MNTLAPAWLTTPAATALVLLVSYRMGTLHETPAPPSWIRIRLVQGWLALLGVVSCTAGLSYTDGDAQTKTFAAAWIATSGLLAIVVLLAFLDIANNLRLRRGGHLRTIQP